MVTAIRLGMLGQSDIGIVTAYAIVIAFAVGLFSVCLVLMNRGTGIRE